MYNYDTEKDDEPDWDRLDQRADDLYSRHKDELAHLPKDIWDQVRHLPTVQAIALGGQLLFVQRQADINKAIAKSIWGVNNNV